MGKIYKSITELVGHTPLVELTNYERKHGLKATLLGKLEYFNPTGSVKDRAALNMLQDAIASGKLKEGQTIVDNTSGNTGIALAAFAHALGHEMETFLEPGVSQERVEIFKAYGVPQYWFGDIKGFQEAVESGTFSLKTIQDGVQSYADDKGFFYINQCGNDKNPQAHYKTTGPEIWEDTDGKVDIVVALVGTGGTVAGLSRYFKEKDENIQIIAVQPDVNSRLDENNKTGNTIDGVVAFDELPKEHQSPFFQNLDVVYDECINVSAQDAYDAGKELIRTDGIFLGQSAGAALYAATVVAERPENAGKNIVIIMADNGTKYLSTNMYK